MQSSAAAVSRSLAAGAAAVAGLKTFATRCGSKQNSEFPPAVARSVPSPTYISGAAAAGEEEGKNASLVVDGKLNFRVRKKRQRADCIGDKVQDSSALIPPLRAAGNPPSAPSSEGREAETSAAVISSLNGSPSVVVAAVDIVKTSVRRRSVRLKRSGEEEQSLIVKNVGATELSESRSSNAQRFSKKISATAVCKSTVGEAGLCAPNAGLLQGSSAGTDFWHSSLSESSGTPIMKDMVEAAVLPILPGNNLTAPEDVAVALEHLKSADPLLRTVIEMHEGPKFEKCKSAFTSLVRSIVFQQLATNAAAAIFGRVVNLCEGLDNVTPTTISQLSAQQLRAVGISGRKASYLHDLAGNFLSGALSDSSIYDMNDEALMKALTAVKGIGVWSVHMFMLFSLHRPDVLPVGDLGVRKGFQKLYQLNELPTPAQVEKIALSWQPYRSVGSWYMWRVMSNTLPLKQTK